ncbi:hypothetical protein AB0N09_28040 [Streptomyces erythrochromogenes]|uniref:hypothetical protein n=1 Tax=Streptomyces erythrochromogenes TaxID=285574 RepID=UPI0034469179
MPNAPLAGAILAAIAESHARYDQDTWLSGPADHLPTDTDPGADTTLDIAAWAAHLTGHTLHRSALITTATAGEKDARLVDDVGRRALGLGRQDAVRLFTRSERAQALAALGQLADGAPAIHWETARAFRSLAREPYTPAERQQAGRVWGITHDLTIDGVRRSGARGIPANVMRHIAASWATTISSADGPWRDERGIWTTANGRRYTPRLSDAAVVYPGNMRAGSQARTILGTNDLTAVAGLGNWRLVHILVPAGKAAELTAGGHTSLSGLHAEDVYSYLGTTWPPLAGDACQRCGETGFLAYATRWPGRPAFCVTCHDRLRTEEAAHGHQCADGCPHPTGHTGLCHP